MSTERANRELGGIAGNSDALISLTSSEIHLWFAFCDEIKEERLLCAYRELLNPPEKEQESRFYFAGDRHRYLVTRVLVRTVLSRYVSVHSRDWLFSKNAYGRPYIVNTEAMDRGLSFNISHTQGLIVLGVTTGRALGVDVENFAARSVSIDIANHYFAPREVAALNATEPPQQQYRFFEYWTFKESYIKARGMGLSLPLDKFSFHYGDDRTVDLATHPELGDDPARWQFWQLRPAAGHLLAVCAEKNDTRPQTLIIRRTIPAVSEKILTQEFSRPPYSDPLHPGLDRSREPAMDVVLIGRRSGTTG
jgi:4'-phosphopantetheinyl transferase